MKKNNKKGFNGKLDCLGPSDYLHDNGNFIEIHTGPRWWCSCAGQNVVRPAPVTTPGREIYPGFTLIGRDQSRLCSDWLDHYEGCYPIHGQYHNSQSPL